MPEFALRARLCLAARCARRLFPLLVIDRDPDDLLQDDGPVRQCDEAIAVAESFAAGEPGSHLRAGVVASRLVPEPPLESVRRNGVSYERYMGERGLRRRGAAMAYYVAATVSWAGTAAFRAAALSPPSSDDADRARSDAEWAIRCVMDRLPGDVEERDKISEAYMRDVESLERLRPAPLRDDRRRPLGRAVEPSWRGPLGPLWAAQPPEWFRYGTEAWRGRLGPEIEPRVVEFRDWRSKSAEERVRLNPHFVCWGPISADTADAVAKEIVEVQDGPWTDHPRPGLFVYAPGLPFEAGCADGPRRARRRHPKRPFRGGRGERAPARADGRACGLEPRR